MQGSEAASQEAPAADAETPTGVDGAADGRLLRAGDTSDWPEEILRLTEQAARSLAFIDIHATYKCVWGGRAPIANLKKTDVVKATWRKRSIWWACLRTPGLRTSGC